MRTIMYHVLRCLFLISIFMVTAVAYAQDTPVGRTVTTADWQLRLPIIGLIVVFTLLVTGTFFYFAARKLRRTTP